MAIRMEEHLVLGIHSRVPPGMLCPLALSTGISRMAATQLPLKWLTCLST